MDVAGVWPNFVKAAPIIFAVQRHKQAARIVDTIYSVFQTNIAT